MSTIIHISADKHNTQILTTLLQDNDQLFILQDTMIDGPLMGEEGSKLDEIRNGYKSDLSAAIGAIFTEEKGNVTTVMEISTALSNNDDTEVIYWMGGNATDVLGYFFILHFLRNHYQKINVINIAGLPFLDDDMKLFFPDSISDLPPAQIKKALKLKRPITASEMEIDGEEWKSIKATNGDIRILDGNKKIKSVNIDHFDSLLSSIHKPGSKYARTIQLANTKNKLALSPEFIENRLQIMDRNRNSTSEESDTL